MRCYVSCRNTGEKRRRIGTSFWVSRIDRRDCPYIPIYRPRPQARGLRARRSARIHRPPLEPDQVFWFVLRGGRFVDLGPGPDGIYRSEVFPGLWLEPNALWHATRGDFVPCSTSGLSPPSTLILLRGWPNPAVSPELGDDRSLSATHRLWTVPRRSWAGRASPNPTGQRGAHPTNGYVNSCRSPKATGAWKSTHVGWAPPTERWATSVGGAHPPLSRCLIFGITRLCKGFCV